jgi:hypothetical protein
MAATPPFGIPEADYEVWAAAEVARWRREMAKPPTTLDLTSKGVQVRVARMIPERVHATVTAFIQRMTETILAGADLVAAEPLTDQPLSVRDARALRKIGLYRATASVEGGVTGAAGFLASLSDFPALMTLKIQLLFELAAIYGHDVAEPGERLLILRLFELAFSSAERRAAIFAEIEDWDARAHPQDLSEFDWRTFQQEYRDSIDLAKLAQLVPIIGAPAGAVVNWRLTQRVGGFAMNAYRMRWIAV